MEFRSNLIHGLQTHIKSDILKRYDMYVVEPKVVKQYTVRSILIRPCFCKQKGKSETCFSTNTNYYVNKKMKLFLKWL